MKRTEYDRDKAEQESMEGGAAPKAEDDYTEQEAAARKQHAMMDEDFRALHQLVNGAKLTEDEDLLALRHLVNDANRVRLHRALDRVLDGVRERRRCAGDRAFLKHFGIRP